VKYAEFQGEKFHFLVTGGAGFIGTNLAMALLENAQKVTVLDNFLTGRRENIDDISSLMRGKGINPRNFQLIEGDIRDLKTCETAAKGVDFVLHNAALGSVPRSIEDPSTTNEINVGGTVNMLFAAKKNGVSRFVYASSSSVYGDSAELPKREGREGRPLSPYAASKLSSELYAINFERVYGMSVVGLRYFNVFGPRQDFNSPYAAVIPIFITKLLGGAAPTINGDGSASRDFTYVENIVLANVRAVFSGATGVYNIACGDSITLDELYKKIAALLGSPLKAVYGPERLGDIRHSTADIAMAKKFLNYSPAVSFEKGLELSIDWYKGMTP
jgi:UDP-N-acetylglucosamine 4-epimerase